jgi:hypothetical protein
MGRLERLLADAMAASLLDLLDPVGTEQDRLAPLRGLAGGSGHDARYLALRAHQGELPAVKQGGRWASSRRAVGLCREHIGRS